MLCLAGTCYSRDCQRESLDDLSLRTLFADTISESLGKRLKTRFSSKVQGVVDKLAKLDLEIYIETGEPLKR